MTCGDALPLMHAYLDGELPAPTSLAFEAHTRECPACSKMLTEQKELQSAMKSDSLYYRAPAGLRERLQSSLDKTRRPRPFAWRWLATAACLLLFVGLGFLLAQLFVAPAKQDRLTEQVVASHIRSLQVDKKRLVDIRDSDRHEVKPWFGDKLDFSPAVPDLSKQDFTLVGGRLDYLDGRPVAAVIYKRRQHFINVFVWPDPATTETRAQRETRQGFHVIHWSHGGMNYWVVSDLNADELDEFAHALK
jgi:anti-sigma factor RsiW